MLSFVLNSETMENYYSAVINLAQFKSSIYLLVQYYDIGFPKKLTNDYK